jgi:hypothetical protein
MKVPEACATSGVGALGNHKWPPEKSSPRVVDSFTSDGKISRAAELNLCKIPERGMFIGD